MKIEIDLDKVRAETMLRKEAIDKANSITVQVRKWGEMNLSPAEIPDEILVEMMQGQIKSRIAEFMQYAPDISEIKPNEVLVQLDPWRKQKQVVGSFYYCSQIVDHWENKKDKAVAEARESARANALYDLLEEFGEDSNQGEIECWQKYAYEMLSKRLNELDDEDDE